MKEARGRSLDKSLSPLRGGDSSSAARSRGGRRRVCTGNRSLQARQQVPPSAVRSSRRLPLKGERNFSPPLRGGDGSSAARIRGRRPRIRSANRPLQAFQAVPPLSLVPRDVSPEGREKLLSPAPRGRRFERSEKQRGPTAHLSDQPFSTNSTARPPSAVRSLPHLPKKRTAIPYTPSPTLSAAFASPSPDTSSVRMKLIMCQTSCSSN